MKENLFDQTSCIILSAGSSVRMGKHKALLNFNTNETFLEKITATYVKLGFVQVIVVVNHELLYTIAKLELILPKEVELVINPFPQKGRFYSLQTGMQKLNAGNYCFFQNIDNPFTTAETLTSLINRKTDADVIIPEFKSQSGHPVLLSPGICEHIIAQTETELRIDLFLQKFKIKKTEVGSGSILTNINTMREFRAAGF